MKNNLATKFVSYNPAMCNEWMLQVSKSVYGWCVVMTHTKTKQVRIAYTKTRDDATMFVLHVVEKEE